MSFSLRSSAAFAALLLVLSGVAAAEPPPRIASGDYDFRIERHWLRMPDGVRLSATIFMPIAKTRGEKFPPLLELLPYRKDDMFYQRDYPLYSWFAQHGYAAVKVDVRGTGSSEGRVPDREYSTQEIDDAVEIIRQLAGAPWSRGKVGMWGISWGGFNALITAMRRPPELGAVLAMHATDDLFHDDVHFIDGALHIDPYILEMDHTLAMPRSPDYRIDAAFRRERFDAYPWVLTYLKQARDGPFWRDDSLRFNPGRIAVPVYLIGGLLDGYRDAVPRLLQQLGVPMKAEIGPWNHNWPDNGIPGPNYEWRERALAWWDRWLKGDPRDPFEPQRLVLFLRDAHPPDANIQRIPGRWIATEWPPPGSRQLDFYAIDGALQREPPAAPRSRPLLYRAGSGTAAGLWWGEATGDMQRDDAGSAVYDSPPLSGPLTIAGFPEVQITAASDAPAPIWSIRLESVDPEGRVSLVTGAVFPIVHRNDRLTPTPLPLGMKSSFLLPLHFTTWTFPAGHRIRLAVSNAQFPMIWPTAGLRVSTLIEGETEMTVSLPQLPSDATWATPWLPAPEPRAVRPDATDLPGGGWPKRWNEERSINGTKVATVWNGDTAWRIGTRRFRTEESHRYEVDEANPSHASFLGKMRDTFRLPGRTLVQATTIEIHSDATTFQVVVTRTLRENGRLRAKKVWHETLPRDLN